MPTIITHAVVGIVSGKTIAIEKKTFMFWTLSVICPILPDADVIAFGLGIPYGHFFGHRGFFHSPFFALLLSLVISLTFFRARAFSKSWWKILIYFFTITASHGILDAFTNGGLGIALLSPFENTRYFFPYTPIEVSPIDARAFFTNRGLTVLASEIKWIWMPILILCISLIIIRKIVQNRLSQKIGKLMMKSPKIESIQWGSIKIEGYPSGRDFMIYPGGAKSWNWNESNTSHEKGIQPQDVRFIIDKGAEYIVMAIGMNSRLKVSYAAIEFLKKTGTGYCILSTEDAVREYNRLVLTTPVGGLFHTTC